MGRHPDPLSPYRVSIHKNGNYFYASTQPIRYNEEKGKNEHYRIHWGTISKDNKFIPNETYRNAPAEIREKLIFPDGLDLSEIKNINDKNHVDEEKIKKILLGAQNALYGDVWFLEKIAEITGIKEDLLEVFDNDKKTVNDILTLSYFLFSGGSTYNHVEAWQKVEKTPSDYFLLPYNITRLTQKISAENRKDLFSLRSKRIDDEDLCAIDSTSCSTYGKRLADIRYGRNKENDNLPQTIESVVYSLKKHAPIYFRSFQGNTPDSRSLDVMAYELEAAGFKNLIFITDRGFETIKNLEKHIIAKRKIIMASKTTQKHIKDIITSLGEFSCAPKEMSFAPKEGLFFLQKKLNYQLEDENGNLIVAENLRLNLYLDPKKRVSERMELYEQEELQRSTLESIVSNRIIITNKESFDEDFSLFNIEYKTVTILIKYEQKKSRRDTIHIAYLDDIIEKKLIVENKNELIANYNEYNLFFNDEAVLIVKFTKDDKKIEQRSKRCGFFANTTLNLDYDPIEAHNYYRLRDEQEKYYFMMKGPLSSKRHRAYSQNGKDGRRFILFVAQIIGCYISYVRQDKLFNKYKSIESILDEMRPIRYIKYEGMEPILTPFIGNQVKICDSFGILIPEGCAPEYAVKKTNRGKRGRPRKPRVEVDL